MAYIDFHFISPNSKFFFNKNFDYILVTTNIDNKNCITLSKKIIPYINNVSNTIRSFAIPFSVSGLTTFNNPNISIKLFEHNKNTNLLNLLFTGSIDMEQVEFGIKTFTKLYTPLGKIRSCKYYNDTAFLEEGFHNYENLNLDNKCIVFFNKSKIPHNIMQPIIIKIDTDNTSYIYNRYSNNVIKEHYPTYLKKKIVYLHGSMNNLTINKKHKLNIEHFDKNNKSKDSFLVNYPVDTDIYDFIVKYPYLVKIETLFRPLAYQPYLNNLVTSPIDSRVRGFYITPTLKFDNKYNLSNLIPDKAYQIMGGGGFHCRVTPLDCKDIFSPYSAHLRKIIYKNNMTILKFDSEYFIPPDVHERPLLSVVNGNDTHGGVGVGAGPRYYPEYKEPHRDNTLRFYVIILGKLKFTSPKLVNINNTKKCKTNHEVLIRSLWIEGGEVIGFLYAGGGSVITLFNRPLNFTSDIKHYSGIESLYKPIQKPIECFVKTRDLICAIE